MASGEYHCKDCGLYFESSQSLEVHLQYHNENLINMWMNSEDKKECLSATNISPSHGNSDLVHTTSSESLNLQNVSNSNLISIEQNITTSMSGCSTTVNNFKMEPTSDPLNVTNSSSISNSNYYKQDNRIKSEPTSTAEANPPSPPFIGPPPISPMDYDYKMSPSLQSPQNSIISQGPPSGPGSIVSYPQQSPSGYYNDYNQPLLQQSHNSYGNYSNYANGSYDDPYYCRNSSGISRFNSYTGSSPVPTPSPSTSLDHIKEERLTPNNTEILDLDSQKVLNSVPSSQPSPIGPLPPMWRPHEQFPSPNSTTTVGTAPTGLGHAPSGVGLSPTGIVSSHHGLGPSSGSLRIINQGIVVPPSAIPPSSLRMGQPPSSLGPSPKGLGATAGGISLTANLNPTGLGPSMGMLPPMGQVVYGGPHSISQTHSVVPNSSNNTSMSSFYPQGLSVSGGINSNSVQQFGSAQISSPSPREGPPTEYPSNVKRAKSFKCDDCNKWFTSHGHLKRHYNTTLHKNMTKLNSNPPSASNSQTTVPVQELTRPPILSPSSKSIGEVSTSSSHDDDTSMSTNDTTESTTVFHTTGSAFQPPTVSVASYSTHTSYPGHSSASLCHINANIPQYSQTHSFINNEQPLAAPAMYHGHFSTNSTYPPQTPVNVSGNPFFPSGNYIYQQQGGLHGPGLHSLSEYPGPNPVDSFNSFRINGDRLGHQINLNGESGSGTSPDPTGDTGSEASMDSSESSTGTIPTTENYKCNDCSKTFNRMCYLTQHRSTYHEGEKPFKCGTCGKRFPDEITFTDHQGKHAGEKPYKCEVCPKQFNHKTDLRRHMCLHTGEKPFSCEQCGKGFIRKDHMLKHFQTHRKKALAAAANSASSHPSIPSNTPGFPPHGLGPQHSSITHAPPHGPHGRPQHVVAPPVY